MHSDVGRTQNEYSGSGAGGSSAGVGDMYMLNVSPLLPARRVFLHHAYPRRSFLSLCGAVKPTHTMLKQLQAQFLRLGSSQFVRGWGGKGSLWGDDSFRVPNETFWRRSLGDQDM